jgi:hypothetical protein
MEGANGQQLDAAGGNACQVDSAHITLDQALRRSDDIILAARAALPLLPLAPPRLPATISEAQAAVTGREDEKRKRDTARHTQKRSKQPAPLDAKLPGARIGNPDELSPYWLHVEVTSCSSGMRHG